MPDQLVQNEGLFYVDETGCLQEIDPVSKGILGNSKWLTNSFDGAPESVIRNAVMAYCSGNQKEYDDAVQTWSNSKS